MWGQLSVYVGSAECECEGLSMSVIAWSEYDSVAFRISSSSSANWNALSGKARQCHLKPITLS